MVSQRWEERALAAVTGRRKRGKRGRKPGFTPTPSDFDKALIRTHITFTEEFQRLLDTAAQNRDVNRSTYVRRAIAVLVSRDLGMDVADVLYHSPAPGTWTGLQGMRGKRDNAVGITDWCAHPGCDGSHLRQRE